MASHGRKSSRGSIFSISLDAVRSMSRATSRQGGPPTAFSASLLTRCEAIHSAEAEKADASRATVPSAPKKLLQKVAPAGQVVSSHGLAQEAEVEAETCEKDIKHKLPRPLSWLPNPRSLPQRKRVDRSISTPVLTSTTNKHVAQSEGVRCGELTETALVQSEWNPGVGWVPVSSIGGGELSSSSVKMDWQPLQCSESAPVIVGVSGAMFRMRKAISGRFSSYTAARRPGVDKKSQFSRIASPPLPLDVVVERRRAEGLSLCKQKIRTLTGHGNVKRKPVESIGAVTVPCDFPDQDQPLLTSAPQLCTSTDGTHDQQRDSSSWDLEKSFINAVDELDFEHSPEAVTMSNKPLPPPPTEPDPYEALRRTGVEVSKVTGTGIHTSRTQNSLFVPQQRRMVPTTAQNPPYPTGANPLGMHRKYSCPLKPCVRLHRSNFQLQLSRDRLTGTLRPHNTIC